MKFALRILTMTIAFAGLAAASLPASNLQITPNALTASVSDPGTDGLPIPLCGPGVPFCSSPAAVGYSLQ